MRLSEITEDMEHIDEGVITRLLGAAALVAGGWVGGHLHGSGRIDQQPTSVATASTTSSAAKGSVGSIVDRYAEIIKSKYQVDPDLVKQIVQTAVKHEYSDFPKAADILAVVGVESSFNPKAKSALKTDPAVGLMQVRPGVWGMSQSDLATIDQQIAHGSKVLRTYYEKLGSREAALHAYNVGITNHRRSVKDPSKGNPRYVPKINRELRQFSTNGETGTTSTR